MNTMRTPEKDYWRQTYDTRLFLQIRTVFRMKKTLKYTALLVCFLAGLQLLVGGLVRSGFIGAGDGVTGWIETFFRLVLNPAPKTTLLVLALALSVRNPVLEGADLLGRVALHGQGVAVRCGGVDITKHDARAEHH